MTAGTAPDPETTVPRPDWAHDMADLHAHAARRLGHSRDSARSRPSRELDPVEDGLLA